jgi:hypothetical protein
MHRSVPKQIEHWARLGKAEEENPDMPISMIQDVFTSLEEAKAGKFSEYQFGWGCSPHLDLIEFLKHYT